MTAPGSGEEENAPAAVYALRVRERARRDIEDVLRWIVEKGQESGLNDAEAMQRARDWKSALDAALADLSTFPRKYPEVEVSRRPRVLLRQMLYRHGRGSVGHHVFYRVAEDSPDGPVVHVLHVRAANRPMKPAEGRDLAKDE